MQISLALTLAVLTAELAFAGKPTPAPSYTWTAILVQEVGSNIQGEGPTSFDCTSSSAPAFCGTVPELTGKIGWVFNSTNAIVRNSVGPGGLYYPGQLSEASFQIQLSDSAGHQPMRFPNLRGGPSVREWKLVPGKPLTTTYEQARTCFVDFTSPEILANFQECVLDSFLSINKFPRPGYESVRLSFIGPSELMDVSPAPDKVFPVTTYFGVFGDASEGYVLCSSNRANVIGWDYPDQDPAAGGPITGTYMQRVGSDAWKVVVNAGFHGENPFRAGTAGAVDDNVMAQCMECPTKFTRTFWENAGKPAINATLYFVRTK